MYVSYSNFEHLLVVDVLGKISADDIFNFFFLIVPRKSD